MKTYKEIEGYFNFYDLYDNIYNIYKSKENVIFVELGVWMGKSIIYMGNKLKEDKSNIKLFAVDNFVGSQNPNPKGEVQITKKVSIEKYGGNFYKQYNQNVIDCGVRNYIIDIQKPSLEAVNDFEDNSIDFIFIDGDHHYNAVSKDFKVWYPKIKNGGVMAGHDITHQGVKRALEEFCKKNNIDYKLVSKSSWKIKK